MATHRQCKQTIANVRLAGVGPLLGAFRLWPLNNLLAATFRRSNQKSLFDLILVQWDHTHGDYRCY